MALKSKEAKARKAAKIKLKRESLSPEAYRAFRDKVNAYKRASYAALPLLKKEKMRAGNTARRKSKDPEDVKVTDRISTLKLIYGLTIHQYDHILQLQLGVCKICEKPETFTKKGVLQRLAVDHNHESEKIRGLLCNRCNTGLTRYHDDIMVIQKAIKYLEKHNQ